MASLKENLHKIIVELRKIRTLLRNDGNNNLPLESYSNIIDNTIQQKNNNINSTEWLKGIISRNIINIIIPDGTTVIGNRAFYECSNLETVELPNTITSINTEAFYDCKSLVNIIFPNKLNTIGSNAFKSCILLSKIYLPNTIYEITDGAFYNCCNCIIDIPYGCSPTIGDNAFYNCKEIILHNNYKPSYELDENNKFYGCDNVTIDISNDYEQFTKINANAFSNCIIFNKIIINDAITTIEDYAFYNCTSLTSVEIPDSVTSVGYAAFNGCISLTSVTIGNSVTSIGYSTFADCTSLTSVTIPNSVISMTYSTFLRCRNLENVTFEENFQCSGLDLSASTKFSVDTMIAMFNALADRTGLSAYTLTLGNTNLAKLSNEQIAIATEKNWILA